MKNRNNNSGSVMAFAIILLMLVSIIITAIMTLNKLEYNISIQEASDYQAELCAKASIDVMAQLLTEQNVNLPKSNEIKEVDITFSQVQNSNNIGTVEGVLLYWEDEILVVETTASYQDRTVSKKGYIQQIDGKYMVKYYDETIEK